MGGGRGGSQPGLEGQSPAPAHPARVGNASLLMFLQIFFHVLNVDSSFNFLKIMKLCGTSHRNQTKHVFWLNPTTKRTEGRLGTKNWKVR